MGFAPSPSGLLIPTESLTRCGMCHEEMPDRQFPAHAELCYRQHENEIQEELHIRETEPWNNALDPEKEEWARERGVTP